MLEPLLVQAGGIFLRTKPRISVQARQCFFQPNPLSPQDLNAKIRKDFLHHHDKHARLQPLTDINHVIIYLNGTLCLWNKSTNGNLVELDIKPTPALEETYNSLKSISHLTVWLNLVFQSIIDEQEMSSEHDEDLLKIKAYLEALKASEDASIQKELAVINRILTFVTRLRAPKTLEQVLDMQQHYLQEIDLINRDYSARATELQLEGMHQIISRWITSERIELDKTRILIVSAHGPREELIEKQYFLNLYAQQGIADAEKGTSHIICVEMLPEQIATVTKDALIDFLKKHLINMRIGKDMLHDPQAMNKDVLGKYAPPVLKRLCPFSAGVAAIQGGKHPVFQMPVPSSEKSDEIVLHPQLIK